MTIPTSSSTSTQWPPVPSHSVRGTTRITTASPGTPQHSRSTSSVSTTPVSSIPRKRQRNGFEASPKTPSYTPYSLRAGSGRRRLKPFTVHEVPRIPKVKPQTQEEWDDRAHAAGVVPEDCHVRQFQCSFSNMVISQHGDVCVIAPTGGGKSHV